MLFGLDRLFKYWHDCAVKNEYSVTPYLVKDNKRHPVAIICPGGGYRMVCNFMEGKPIAEFLNKKGIHAFVLHYRTRKKAHYPHPIEDIVRLVNELNEKQDEYLLDMSNYSIWGFSAGGHMAASFGVADIGYKLYSVLKPSCLVLTYPVITLEKGKTHKGTRHYYCGEKDQKAYEVGCIYNLVNEDYPKTFIWRGDKDKSVPPLNSDLLVNQLEKYHINYLYKKYPNVGHGVGLGIGTTAEGWADLAVDFWLKK